MRLIDPDKVSYMEVTESAKSDGTYIYVLYIVVDGQNIYIDIPNVAKGDEIAAYIQSQRGKNRERLIKIEV